MSVSVPTPGKAEHQCAEMPNVPVHRRHRNPNATSAAAWWIALMNAYEAFFGPPIEIRPVDPVDFFSSPMHAAQKQIWFRAPGQLPDDILHHALLAYASDFALLGTGMLPHKLSFLDPKCSCRQPGSCHLVHHSFRMDDWLLYSMESHARSACSQFNRGQIFFHPGTADWWLHWSVRKV